MGVVNVKVGLLRRYGTSLGMLLAMLFASATVCPQTPSAKTTWKVSAVPTRIVNGAPVLFQVSSPTVSSLTATWLGHSFVFTKGAGKTWFALAGVSLETKPGSYPLQIEGETKAGEKISFQKMFIVARQKYPTVQLTVSKQYTAPSPEQQQIIARDQEVKHKAFATTSIEREWAGRFQAPVTAPISDVFGTRRVFNGATKSVHQGLDYRVPPATPVKAVNAGTILLARPLYFEGNCVVIDHGQGLLTLYLHLSEIKVKEGEAVKRGQEIGLSGATGRATGPHLHLSVRWQGMYLNPAALLSLPVPGN